MQVSLAPRFILSCSEALWHGVRDASRERALLVHTHLAESPSEGREVEAMVGATAARWFERQSVLSRQFVGAHGVHLDGDELAALSRTGSALVHCPGSNLKLGSGIARVRRWRDARVRRGIGSDGAACCNRLDTFHEMSLAAGLSRALDPEAPLAAREVVSLATRDGAEALGLGAVTGSLEVGKHADVVVIDHDAAHHGPNAERDPYVTLVHATRPTDVKATLVHGRVLYRDGQWATLDPGRVLAEARAESLGLARRREARAA
jgi:5-methylthioadenosine/S-adenosylhomocysteine deaminase